VHYFNDKQMTAKTQHNNVLQYGRKNLCQHNEKTVTKFLAHE